MAARLVNAGVKLVAMPDFRHDTKALAAAGKPQYLAAVFVDNPGNPTGTMITKRELGALLRAVPGRVPVIVDEAYYEYACGDTDYPDTLKLRRSHPNLIITRTFSKAYGLAGLRIGYGIASPEIIRDLDRVRPPFNTNRMAQIAAAAALDDEVHLRRSRETNAKGLAYLQAQLEKLGLRCVPSFANFVLVDVSGRFESGGYVYEELLRRGVIVRPMTGYGLPGFVRISIGRSSENRALIKALKDIK